MDPMVVLEERDSFNTDTSSCSWFGSGQAVTFVVNLKLSVLCVCVGVMDECPRRSGTVRVYSMKRAPHLNNPSSYFFPVSKGGFFSGLFRGF